MKGIIFAVLFILLISCSNTRTPRNQKQKLFFDSAQLVQDLKYLSGDNLQGRLPGTKAMEQARDFVKSRFRASGLDSFTQEYLQSFPLVLRGEKQDVEGKNFIGVIKGKRNPDNYIVVTAHYDHIGVRGEKIYNGSNDNASGAAALFTIASYFKKNLPDHSLIFVAFDAEEQGLLGAKAFVENPPVPKENLKLNINMDMIGRDQNDDLYAVGTYHYPFLRSYLEKVASTSAINLRFGYDKAIDKEDWTSQSDHYQFHKNKIPFIYFGVEDFENHHKHTDDFPTMTLSFYVKAVQTIIEAISIFDKNLPDIKSSQKL